MLELPEHASVNVDFNDGDSFKITSLAPTTASPLASNCLSIHTHGCRSQTKLIVALNRL